MAEIATLAVRHRCWDDSPTLRFRTIQTQEKPLKRISRTLHTTARPERLRKAECRELFNSHAVDALPSIHVHGVACRCGQPITENELQDTLLATKISSLTKSLPTTKPPPLSQTPLKHSRSKSGAASHTPAPRPTFLLSTLSRFFSPSPSHETAPSFQQQANFCLAASTLDIDKVARYLLHTIPPLPVNAPNYLGMTSLMAAVRLSSSAAAAMPKAQLEMVRFLVEGCGADVEATRVDCVTGLGESVLSMACAVVAVEVVRYLIQKGVAVDRRLPSGRGMGRGVALGRGQTALHVAVLADRAECVEVLVREGKADVDAVFDAAEDEGRRVEGGLRGLRGRTRSVSRGKRDGGPRHPVSALHLAHGSPACTRVLLEGGAKVDVKDGYGRTPLGWAADAGNAYVVRLLIDVGAERNAAETEVKTALITVDVLEDEKASPGTPRL